MLSVEVSSMFNFQVRKGAPRLVAPGAIPGEVGYVAKQTVYSPPNLVRAPSERLCCAIPEGPARG